MQPTGSHAANGRGAPLRSSGNAGYPASRRGPPDGTALAFTPTMQGFTPLPAAIGGTLIGVAAALLLVPTGRVAGISGIVDGALHHPTTAWRWAFVAGLVAGGALLRIVAPDTMPGLDAAPLTLVAAGLAVGFGTRVSGGCTSGHGIAGVSRLSPRSLVATATFMATAFVTAAVIGGGHG